MSLRHIYKAQRGKGGGTYAHWQIALAYAKYLSPALLLPAVPISPHRERSADYPQSLGDVLIARRRPVKLRAK